MKYNQKPYYLILRAEKEKSQYFGELNDIRSSTNRLASDKVEQNNWKKC